MRTSGNFHKDLEKDLRNEKFKMLFEAEKERLELTEKIRKAVKKSNLSIRNLANQMGTSKSQVERLLSDSKANIEINTLLKLAHAVGKRLQIDFK